MFKKVCVKVYLCIQRWDLPRSSPRIDRRRDHQNQVGIHIVHHTVRVKFSDEIIFKFKVFKASAVEYHRP